MTLGIDPMVTLVVLNFNGYSKLGEKLGTNLRSILKTDYENYQAIIVDNHSTDKSVQYISNLGLDPSITRLVVSESNLGFAGGNNFGARFADQDSEYYVFLNNDVRIIDKSWLKTLTRVAREFPQIGVVGCEQAIPAQSSSASGMMDELGFCHSFGKLQSGLFGLVSYVGGAAFLIRRRLFDGLGGFDEDFFLEHEEVDLCWRVWIHGFQVALTSGSIVFHEAKATTGTGTYLEYYGSRNRMMSLLKNYQLRRAITLSLVTSVLYIAITMYGLVTRTRSSEYIHALIWNLRKLPVTWKKRVSTQSTRTVSDTNLIHRRIIVPPRPFQKLGNANGFA